MAEISWATKVITNHYSYKSCENIGAFFQTMFPDSDITKQFTCGEKKATYLGTFGIAPHFLPLMKERIKKESGHVLLFGKSLNHEMKRCQLVHLRYWHDSCVQTRNFPFFLQEASHCRPNPWENWICVHRCQFPQPHSDFNRWPQCKLEAFLTPAKNIQTQTGNEDGRAWELLSAHSAQFFQGWLCSHQLRASEHPLKPEVAF